MPTTVAARMTRFLKRNKGQCPAQYKELYRAYRQGDSAAGEELLKEVETEDDRLDDDADRWEAEELSLEKTPVNFTVGKGKPMFDLPEIPPQGQKKSPKKETAKHDAAAKDEGRGVQKGPRPAAG